MTHLDIEKLIDTIVGFMLGVVLSMLAVLIYSQFKVHSCASPVSYTLHNVQKTSGGYYQSELHLYGQPHGVIYSQYPIEVGFMVNEDNLK